MTDLYSEIINGAPTFVQDGEVLPADIFFHCCCGPCTEWPLYFLRLHGIEPKGYFYNPNIHPLPEWQRRLAGLEELAVKHDFSFAYDENFEEDTWRNFASNKKSDHCQICYAKRLYSTAAKASELGYSGFSTALLVSPYQNRELILHLGNLAAKKFNISFYGFDFRTGYKLGQDMARRDGLYRQKFCGCIYSLAESDLSAKITKELNYASDSLPVPRLVD